MLSGHLPRGSRLLVVAADDRWKDMMRAQDAALFDSWEVAETMDVDTAKEWSQHAAASLQWQEAATSDPRQNAQVSLARTRTRTLTLALTRTRTRTRTLTLTGRGEATARRWRLLEAINHRQSS